jgi:hypothetical protein
VANELAVHAEHAHAVVAFLTNGNVTVATNEAQSVRVAELTVAVARGAKLAHNRG